MRCCCDATGDAALSSLGRLEPHDHDAWTCTLAAALGPQAEVRILPPHDESRGHSVTRGLAEASAAFFAPARAALGLSRPTFWRTTAAAAQRLGRSSHRPDDSPHQLDEPDLDSR
jgi:hypothetical protein